MPAECPNFRRPLHWARTFVATAWSTWTCPGCGSVLGINKRRRFLLVGLCALLPIMVIGGLQRLGMGYIYSVPLIFGLVILLVLLALTVGLVVFTHWAKRTAPRTMPATTPPAAPRTP